MDKSQRNIEPMSLAEHLTSRGGRCPIPFTHDRLHEAHHWWHEMARWYHEPQPFRFALGAFVQASRNITFMLQKERSAFQDFSWYENWVEKAKTNPILKWLKDTRTDFVHAQSLEPNSWLRMRCIGLDASPFDFEDEESQPFEFVVSPFECTHHYMNSHIETGHSHEFERFWAIDNLPNRELLDGCAELYDAMDALVAEAHQLLDAEFPSHRTASSKRALPCMEDTLKYRVARTVIKDGKEVLEEEPSDMHHH